MRILSKTKNNKTFFNLIYRFYLLLLFTAGIIYFMPKIISILFLLFTLVKFFRSKNDCFWFAYAFIITFDIAGLFLDQTTLLFSLNNFSITYLSLFGVVSFLKYPFSTKVQLGYLRKPYLVYFTIFFILLIYGLIVHGILGGGASGYRYIIYFLQTTLYFPLFYTIPKIIDNFKKVTLFSMLMISLVPLNLIGQVYMLIYGMSISTQFGLSGSIIGGLNVLDSDKILRPVFGITPLFFAFIMSLFFYFHRSKELVISKSYLLVFVLLNFLSIYLSATRGYILTYIVILFLIILNNIYYKRGLKFAIRSFILFLIGMFLLLASPTLRMQISKSTERVLSMEEVARGDPTAGGTLSRLTTRHDRVMEYYYTNSKILGTGISKEGFEAFDQHVGNQSMLATGGLLEVVFVVIFLFYIVAKTILINKTLHSSNDFKNTILILIFFLIGFLVIHSTSSFKFGIVGWIKFGAVFVVPILFFTIYNNILIEAKIKNYQILHPNE